MNEQTRKDTEKAASRTYKTEQPRESRFDAPAPTFAEREAASGLTNTTSGRDDFYSFSADSRIAREEPQDWGVHDAVDNATAPRQGSFPAIICLNGEPRYATIQGQIGGPVES